jgi:hypothetical protein
MVDRFRQAAALVKDAESRLSHLCAEYERSLHEKQISVELQVAIKGVLDSLRSALDYVAYELHNRFGTPRQQAKVYFPIAAKGARREDFPSLVGKNIPGLADMRPDLVPVLESFQAFTSDENQWLPELASLANENKHANLTPQTRTEDERITVRSSNGAISWNPGQIKFSPGISVLGAPIDHRTQLPISGPGHAVSREIWVDFKFASTGLSVLPLLAKCVTGTRRIVEGVETRV